MKKKKSKKKIKRIKTKGNRVYGFGMFKGLPSFSREDKGDDHF